MLKKIRDSQLDIRKFTNLCIQIVSNFFVTLHQSHLNFIDVKTNPTIHFHLTFDLSLILKHFSIITIKFYTSSRLHVIGISIPLFLNS